MLLNDQDRGYEVEPEDRLPPEEFPTIEGNRFNANVYWHRGRSGRAVQQVRFIIRHTLRRTLTCSQLMVKFFRLPPNHVHDEDYGKKRMVCTNFGVHIHTYKL